MWRWISLNILLLLAVVPRPSVQWHGSPGPWVWPTQGEVWPAPAERQLKQYYYYMRMGSFEIRAAGETCDIVDDAIERYNTIIAREFRLARASVKAPFAKLPHSDPSYKGILSALEIRLNQPCANSGTWPHLHMDESYTLEVSEATDIAVLSANSTWGILRGIETFSQLVTIVNDTVHLKIICQTIVDSPAFPHRGLLLDTSRHYLPVADILLTLDAMSYNKMNVLHWHIVDDNSFPYESSTYESLSKLGAYHSTMVYSRSTIEAILNYARLRGIRVLPEFDTPGHVAAWGVAYPWLLTKCYDSSGKPNGKLGPMNPTNPQVFQFLRNLFTEVKDVFPEKYFHLGGDEVPFDCWASNPDVVSYMQTHNMSRNYARLEAEHINKVLDITNSLNATPVVWQEVFFNGIEMPNNTVVHVWTGVWKENMEKVTKAGHPVLLSACWYLDHIGGGGDWNKYYVCDPLSFPSWKKVKDLVLGGEACMWGEFVDESNIHPRIWPRASAAAERLWSRKVETLEDAAKRLEELTCRLRRRGIRAQPPNGPSFCIS